MENSKIKKGIQKKMINRIWYTNNLNKIKKIVRLNVFKKIFSQINGIQYDHKTNQKKNVLSK